MNKQFVAVLAALLMTGCIGGSMLAIGGVALFNPGGTTTTNSNVQASQAVDTNSASQTQIRQMQDLISQYQARELQYQARETQYKQQLEQGNTQIQQAQQQMQQIQILLNTLQEHGLITEGSDGSIYIDK